MGVTNTVYVWIEAVWRMLRGQVGVTGWRDPVWRMLRAQVGVTYTVYVWDSYSRGC